MAEKTLILREKTYAVAQTEIYTPKANEKYPNPVPMVSFQYIDYGKVSRLMFKKDEFVKISGLSGKTDEEICRSFLGKTIKITTEIL